MNKRSCLGMLRWNSNFLFFFIEGGGEEWPCNNFSQLNINIPLIDNFWLIIATLNLLKHILGVFRWNFEFLGNFGEGNGQITIFCKKNYIPLIDMCWLNVTALNQLRRIFLDICKKRQTSDWHFFFIFVFWPQGV